MSTLLRMWQKCTLFQQCASCILLFTHYNLSVSFGRPTFVFLKGSTKVDQVRGADKRYDFPLVFIYLPLNHYSGLQNAIRKHSGPSTTSGPVFSGKGQTLGGDTPPTDITREAKHIIDQATGGLNNLDPQVKVLLGLAGLYLLFWFLS